MQRSKAARCNSARIHANKAGAFAGLFLFVRLKTAKAPGCPGCLCVQASLRFFPERTISRKTSRNEGLPIMSALLMACLKRPLSAAPSGSVTSGPKANRRPCDRRFTPHDSYTTTLRETSRRYHLRGGWQPEWTAISTTRRFVRIISRYERSDAGNSPTWKAACNVSVCVPGIRCEHDRSRGESRGSCSIHEITMIASPWQTSPARHRNDSRSQTIGFRAHADPRHQHPSYRVPRDAKSRAKPTLDGSAFSRATLRRQRFAREGRWLHAARRAP